MPYALAYTRDASDRLGAFDPKLALGIRERLLELAARPQLGRSITAPVPCMLWGFTINDERGPVTVSVTYEFSQDETTLVITGLGTLREV